jgi:hypothetical protein
VRGEWREGETSRERERKRGERGKRGRQRKKTERNERREVLVFHYLSTACAARDAHNQRAVVLQGMQLRRPEVFQRLG